MELVKIVICIVVLFMAPFLVGNVFFKKTFSGTYISGVLLSLGVFEALSIVAVKKAWDFQMLSKGFLFSLVVIVCAGTVIFFTRVLKKQRQIKFTLFVDKEFLWILLAFCLVGSVFFIYAPKLESWYLVPETVTTILDTNSLHGYNPLTGQPLAVAKSLRDSLINLPAFYACLIEWFGVGQSVVLFKIIPLWVLFISFMVFYRVASFIFQDSKVERTVFMWVYAIVLFCGDKAYMNESYQMLHYAYEGRAILTGVLLPYCFYLLITAFAKQVKKTVAFIKYIAEYILVFVCGLLTMGVDYGLGLPGAMTLIGIITGSIWLLFQKIRKGRIKA